MNKEKISNADLANASGGRAEKLVIEKGGIYHSKQDERVYVKVLSCDNKGVNYKSYMFYLNTWVYGGSGYTDIDPFKLHYEKSDVVIPLI